ncbi:hypothetical protein SCA03_44800 [Streptomyces cacaoi]|uniref:Uncharacterized protein n=1 Tax=Streptomyces cacaoi TaxID=1898 RepID=A0A4Y3R3Q4_STRCI|nr:hypothetical protein SCA03_44800 [Streptomyces cacaoi]
MACRVCRRVQGWAGGRRPAACPVRRERGRSAARGPEPVVPVVAVEPPVRMGEGADGRGRVRCAGVRLSKVRSGGFR